MVNVIGMTYLTKIVDGMINNKSGKILNISSIVGYYPLPYQAVYASKAYILSFSQALHSELKDKSVHVSTLCPANIKTDFNKKAGLEKLYKNYSEKKIGIEWR